MKKAILTLLALALLAAPGASAGIMITDDTGRAGVVISS
jgi:hypothetical protein